MTERRCSSGILIFLVCGGRGGQTRARIRAGAARALAGSVPMERKHNGGGREGRGVAVT